MTVVLKTNNEAKILHSPAAQVLQQNYQFGKAIGSTGGCTNYPCIDNLNAPLVSATVFIHPKTLPYSASVLTVNSMDGGEFCIIHAANISIFGVNPSYYPLHPTHQLAIYQKLDTVYLYSAEINNGVLKLYVNTVLYDTINLPSNANVKSVTFGKGYFHNAEQGFGPDNYLTFMTVSLRQLTDRERVFMYNNKSGRYPLGAATMDYIVNADKARILDFPDGQGGTVQGVGFENLADSTRNAYILNLPAGDLQSKADYINNNFLSPFI